MADVVVQQDDVGIRDQLAVAVGHVAPGVGVGRPVDQPHRHAGSAHRLDPAVAVAVAVQHEAPRLVGDAAAVVVVHDLVELLEQLGRGLGARTEHLGHPAVQHRVREQHAPIAGHDAAQRSGRQQRLDRARTVGLVEQAAVEPGDRLDHRYSIGVVTCLVACERPYFAILTASTRARLAWCRLQR